MQNKCFRALLALCFTLYSCGGSAPNPVLSYQAGDEKRSCTGLKTEIASNEAEIIRLTSEKSSTTTSNVILGVTGFLLIVPWFFMDLKGKEAGELNALRHRNKNLRQFAAEKKDCKVPASKVKFEDKPEEEGEKKKDDKPTN